MDIRLPSLIFFTRSSFTTLVVLLKTSICLLLPLRVILISMNMLATENNFSRIIIMRYF